MEDLLTKFLQAPETETSIAKEPDQCLQVGQFLIKLIFKIINKNFLATASAPTAAQPNLASQPRTRPKK